jgi:AcrR family transcriptional regulator
VIGGSMQYLKDEVRNRIVYEALREFKNKGYKGASVRIIANSSNTSVGNLYKYFSSKEDLYENLIGSVYKRLMDYINEINSVEINDEAEDIFYQLLDKIMEIFKENSIELAILLNKSEGSKYENCKSTFADFITRIVSQTMEYELSLKGRRLKDNFIIYLLSCNLVEDMAVILNQQEDGGRIRKLILDIIDIFFKNILDKIDSEDI